MVVILRSPIAAGMLYDLNPDNLRKQLDYFLENAKTKKLKERVVAALVPHSSYIYSGKVATEFYSAVDQSNFVIIGSNHAAYGSAFTTMRNCLWKTPIGEVVVDDFFADRLLKESGMVEFDAFAHEQEYSIEVQLPFLLHKIGEFKMLPIAVNDQLPDKEFLENCRAVGRMIGKLAKAMGGWKIIGSSDLSKAAQKEFVEIADRQLFKSITKLDCKDLFSRVKGENKGVCGYGAIATTIFAAKEMGAKRGRVVGYGTSADIDETMLPVTGYASVIFY
ncbi:MAG: AmmeMemoRadiSam system protein B [Candidatus Aenigmarchaeota archaeon]|nr:AmmeMemoRadiSam system protein B [Candidatus Aenigmarchaeota archaeon]